MTNLIFENKWLKVYKDGAFIEVEVLESKIEPKVRIYAKENEETGCWELISHRNVSGYGFINTGSYSGSVHRYLYVKFHEKELSSDIVIRHTCDNSRCISLFHLEEGSVQDNNMDRNLRGRTAKGEQSNKSDLSDDDILVIRKDRYTSHVELSKTYSVTPEMISNIRRGKFWTHVYVEEIWEEAFIEEFSKIHAKDKSKISGEKHKLSKLTEDIVKEIREDRTTAHTKLGVKYGVSDRLIKLARYGKTWWHVHQELIWTPEQITAFVISKGRGWTLK